MPIFRAVIVTLLAFMSLSSWGDVQTYPWPETSPQSEKYSVEISQDGVTYYPKELYSEPNLDTSGYDGNDADDIGDHGVSWVNNRSMTYVI